MASVTGIALRMAILAGIYFLAGKLGLSLAHAHPSASPVWPPAGIALAALLWFGPRLWPGVLIGAFFVNWTTHGSLATSLAIATGNTLEAVTGWFLVSRFANGWRCFDRGGDAFRFVVLAGVLATTVSPSVGVSSLALEYPGWDNYSSIWLTWWLGDMLGALIFGMVQQGIVITGVDADWFQVFLGAMLVSAVLVNSWLRRRMADSP